MVAAAKRFKFGWFGDGGHGVRVLQKILSGKKRATACLAYEPEDSEVKVGDTLELVDKHGRVYGTVLITRIDIRPYGGFDEAVAAELGHTLEEIRELMRFANGRQPGADEDMRVTYFEIVGISKVKI